jgi:hypothetical protein
LFILGSFLKIKSHYFGATFSTVEVVLFQFHFFLHFQLTILFIEISHEELQKRALKRYQQVLAVVQEELMVSGSDDFTMFLWNPAKEKKSLARLTGAKAKKINKKYAAGESFGICKL